MSPAITVAIVDDHPVVRDGLAFLLGEQPDLQVVGEGATAGDALRLVESQRPDVLVLDLNLEGQDAVPLVGILRERWPALRILVLSMHDEELYAERLLALGAQGYVMKQEEPAEFLRALRRVAGGESYLSDRMKARLATRGGQAAIRLTGRERAVLQLVAQGLGTRDIGQQLGMSAKTVDSHRRNIRDKLGLETSRDLVRYAVRWAAEPGSGEGGG
jgi:DNA-binding NarL/FixJ family response regulator